MTRHPQSWPVAAVKANTLFEQRPDVEAQRKQNERDRQILSGALAAYVASERRDLLAYAHSFLIVGGSPFSGSFGRLVQLHSCVSGGIPQVAAFIAFERDVHALRKRLGL